jgi:tetratricopeptide (TPR) repeat protein
MPSPAGNPARRSRPSYLAAPPLLSESEPFEGAALLREHPGALGAVLWKSLRDVCAWTATPPDERAALFPPGADQARAAEVAGAAAEPELWGPLLVIQRLVACPGDVDHPRLVHACRAIARWGERRGFTAVQLAFVQAAACLAPGHARLAYSVGRLARDRGEYARAESWLRTSIRLARGADWHTYALAYLSLGTLYQQLGNLPAARSVTLRGYRTTVRRRVRALRGPALHNMFVLAAEGGDYARAHHYARAALECYGEGHPRLPALAYDLGCVWFLNGNFDRALPVLEAVLPHVPDTPERALGLANTARAAAGCGDASRFDHYWPLAAAAADRYGPSATAADAWLNLARGAVSLRQRQRAEFAAGRARELAWSLRLSQVLVEVDAVLESAKAPAREAVERTAETPAALSGADELAREVVRSLGHVAGLAC